MCLNQFDAKGPAIMVASSAQQPTRRTDTACTPANSIPLALDVSTLGLSRAHQVPVFIEQELLR